MTLRELVSAAKAKQQCDWDHTADMMALHANLHAKGKYSRFHFHPMRSLPKLEQDDPAVTYRWLKAQEDKKNGKQNISSI